LGGANLVAAPALCKLRGTQLGRLFSQVNIGLGFSFQHYRIKY